MTMRMKLTFFILMLLSASAITQAQTCGTSIFVDEFNTNGAIPSEWTEVNTNGQVTVVDGRLQFDLTADQPSAYRTFTPVSEKVTVSFTEESTRNYVKCRFDVLSSDGQYLTSIMMGNDGAGTVQYATALDASNLPSTYTGELIDHTYKKNYEYRFAITLDFTTKTFDFYFDGVLGGADIPFIQSASNVAKVSITQISMYSGEGRFFFDNIGLSYPGADRAALSAGITSAEELTFATIISPKYGYSRETYEALKVAQAQAELLLPNCDATQAQIDASATSLATAMADFENSYKDEVVLTLYAGAQLQGETYAAKCAYYNGTLGAFDNKAVSFHLEKGYMLTVAQNVNGTGVSKVYIAADEELRLNFPEDLQQSISFMRVGPWRYTGKRGSSGKSGNNDVVLALNGDWFYDWGNVDASMTECEYVPMNWSGTSNVQALGKDMSVTHHLAFNEPDGAKQANMTVDQAIEKYVALQASGLRLGAPAVTDGTKGREWLDEFMPKAIAAGYRIDFIPVHYYKTMGASAFLAWLKDFYDEYHVPIWVTEFNYGDIWASNEKDKTEEQILTNMKAYCEAMDGADFIERYCVFTWQPSDYGNHSLMSVRSPITLNSVGDYYANHEAPLAYTQETYVNGPDLSASISTALAVSDGMRCHPNPVTDGVLTLDYAEAFKDKDLSLRLFNLNGQEVKQAFHSPQHLDVTDLKNGIYLLRIVGEDLHVSRKIIISHR